MKDPRPRLPWPYRIANALGRVPVAAGLPATRLDEESLSQAAVENAGLTDFGDPYYREGLLQLLDSLMQDAHLHPLGRLMANNIITGYLVQRLRMVETARREPQIFDEPLLPPLIVIGPARSGTTFLHQLLAVDPARRAIPYWQLQHPFPGLESETDETDPRILETEQGLRFRRPLLPEMDAIHPLRADSPEECIVALGLTFNSLVFPTLFPVESYMDWYLIHAASLQKYHEYRRLLQYYQSLQPEQSLALKAPAHTGSLTALTEAVPEALIVQTHRDPVACVSSVLSLLYTFYTAVSYEIDLQRLVELTLCIYERWFERNLAFRDLHPGFIYDIPYQALVADPTAVVRGIYTHFEMPWPERLTTALEIFIGNNRKDKYGKHHYAASDFGLSEAQIGERLNFFDDHLGFSADWST